MLREKERFEAAYDSMCDRPIGTPYKDHRALSIREINRESSEFHRCVGFADKFSIFEAHHLRGSCGHDHVKAVTFQIDLYQVLKPSLDLDVLFVSVFVGIRLSLSFNEREGPLI